MDRTSVTMDTNRNRIREGSAPFVGIDGESALPEVILNEGRTRGKHRAVSARPRRTSAWERPVIEVGIHTDHVIPPETTQRPSHVPPIRIIHTAPEVSYDVRRNSRKRLSPRQPVGNCRPHTSPGLTCTWRDAMEYIRRIRAEDRVLQEQVKQSLEVKDDVTTPEVTINTTPSVLITSPEIAVDLVGDLSDSFSSVLSSLGRSSPRVTPSGGQGHARGLEVSPGMRGGRRLSLAAMRRLSTAGQTFRQQVEARERERERGKVTRTPRSPAQNIEFRYQVPVYVTIYVTVTVNIVLLLG